MASKAVSLPFKEPVSSSFGRRWLKLPYQQPFWNLHSGCDWAKPYGTPLLAVGRGRVTQIIRTRLKGWQIEVTCNTQEKYRCHLLRYEPTLKVGDLVEWGDLLGYSGPHLGWQEDGAAASGPHVHFEYWLNGVPVDPKAHLIYRTEAPASVITKPIPPVEVLIPSPIKKGKLMNSGIIFPRGGISVLAIVNTDTGFYTEWSGTETAYNLAMAKAFGFETYAKVTEGHQKNLKKSLDEVLLLKRLP